MFRVTTFVMIKSLEDISIDVCILFHVYATIKAYIKNSNHSLTFISRKTDRSCAMSIVACPSIITDYMTSFVTNIPSTIALNNIEMYHSRKMIDIKVSFSKIIKESDILVFYSYI